MFIGNMISSCMPCGPFDLRSRIESIDFIALEKNDDGQLVGISEGSVGYNNLFIEVYLQLIAKKKFAANGIGFNSAFACSPADPIILDRIASISIISDNPFDTKVAGEDLSTYFGWGEFAGSNFNELSNLDEITENSWFYLSLISPPSEEAAHKFTITIQLEDERTFILETGNISITP